MASLFIFLRKIEKKIIEFQKRVNLKTEIEILIRMRKSSQSNVRTRK